MIKYSNTYSGEVTVRKFGVTKKFNKRAIKQGLMDREVFWLRQLADFDRTPNIINVVDDTITMTYVGERINKENIPNDWKQQIEYIYNSLQKYQCSHNDIKPDELLVKDNTINIVDFGWSTFLSFEIPANFPTEIGDKFAYGIHNFNDLYSLKKSINYILNET